MPDYPVPVRLVMKNFCSHVNNVVEFGAPHEKVFVRGETGQGKSQIFNAIKYALGKEKHSDEEVFTYEELMSNGEKKKVYKNECQIVLTLRNCGQNPLHQFPPDSEFSIEVKFVRDRKTQYTLIRPDGTRMQISRDDISQYARHDDPLLFVDQAQTSIWTQMTREERFRRISSLIGIEPFQAKVKETYNKLEESERQLIIHMNKFELEKQRFSDLEEKYRRFLEKEAIKKEITDKSNELEIKRVWVLYESFQAQEKEFIDLDNKIGDLNRTKTGIIQDLQQIKNELEKHEISYKELNEKKQTLEGEKDSISYDIVEFNRNLHNFTSKNMEYGLDPKDWDPNKVRQQLSECKQKIEEINGKIFNLKNQQKLKQAELDQLLADHPNIPKDILKLSEDLKKKNISHDFLYSVLDFAEGQEYWRDILEAYISSDKKAILVEPKDRLVAEQINRAGNYDAIILCPREDFPRQDRPTEQFKKWEDILTINSPHIRENTIKKVLDYLLGNVYFADTLDEKEQILNSRRAVVVCQDNYRYDTFSQRKIHKSREYLIGKNARIFEEQRLEHELRQIRDDLNILNDDKSQREHEFAKIKNLNEYFELIVQKPEIDIKKEKLASLSKEIEELTLKIANPKEHKERVERRLHDQKEKLDKVNQELKDTTMRLMQIQSDLNQKSNDYFTQLNSIRDNYQRFKDYVDSSFQSCDLMIYFANYEDEKIRYQGIKGDKINELKSLFKIPDTAMDQLINQLKFLEGQLKGYSDLSDDIPKRYEDMKATLARLNEELKNYEETCRKCEDQHTEAESFLNDRLEKWRAEVNRNFSKVMQMLQLDGELKFQEIEQDGRYGLDFYIANSVGGAKSLIEKSNLSGGEKQRTNIAFIISIILQTQYTYLIWDEPDSAIGDPYRELLAKVIQECFQHRKIIFASPQRIVKGYVKVFDQIIEVFKDHTNHSRISKVRITEDYRKGKGVLNV